MTGTPKAKSKGGRPSAYKPEFADLARKFCMLGATNEELARMLEVATSTIDKWIAEKPEFSGAVKEGREHADALVASRLFSRATGYTHDAVKIFMPSGASAPVYAPYTERYAPDTTAAIFWLKNRRPDVWRDRTESVSKHQLVDENEQPLASGDLARHVAFLLTSGMKAKEKQADSPPLH